jgi:hypothetical protein
MKFALSRRLSLLLWLLIPATAVVLYYNPLSNRFTKISALLIALIAWRGLLSLAWPHRRLRWVLPGVTVLAGAFLLMPARSAPRAELRSDYVAALQRYEGTLYYWGGESRRGIDCSGLIRCGLMNALFSRGARIADPGLIRQSLSLWWNDTSAAALGKEHAGLTKLLFESRTINDADHSRLRPGDLAVTRGGVHILAYLGDGAWIQASPGAGRVITSSVPSQDSWFRQPVMLMRWTVFSGD